MRPVRSGWDGLAQISTEIGSTFFWAEDSSQDTCRFLVRINCHTSVFQDRHTLWCLHIPAHFTLDPIPSSEGCIFTDGKESRCL
jgi:hypothetical protein